MVRRRDSGMMDDALRVFVVTPVWVGPVVAGLMFGLFWVVPWVIPDAGPMKLFEPVSHMLAWIVGGMLLVAWGVSLVVKVFRRG